MKLKDQVASLILSKKLKELRVKQESLYKWCVWDRKAPDYDGEKDRLFTEKEWEDFAEDYIPPESEFYSAFTVAELGELLPTGTTSHINPDKGWHIHTWRTSNPKKGMYIQSKTEANARAKMLIYLIENKLI